MAKLDSTDVICGSAIDVMRTSFSQTKVGAPPINSSMRMRGRWSVLPSMITLSWDLNTAHRVSLPS